MKGCHSCAHAADIAGGRYHFIAWLETPCARCDLRKEDMHSVQQVIEGMRAEPSGEDREELARTRDMLLAIVGELLAMPGRVRDVVCLRVQGKTYAEIADEIGMTLRGIESMLRRTKRRWPKVRNYL